MCTSLSWSLLLEFLDSIWGDILSGCPLYISRVVFLFAQIHEPLTLSGLIKQVLLAQV